ncbi:hypothetical protein PR202_gb19625 [Eleusine coracana subsp. coracana]|uniref:BZIP domain-containing protein n=1 Tax=Eleusine coracana subsp. coracana TaxID=191504 RepID=A0AAV5F8E5_ELECO|nr:hypothetical protein QOZ80_3BG0282630 [Eleusine coracana subsp. coracana]GJN31251.1 hypothetical protein PR202_gb19625 [Eleusine coracana subsp. coracana]
MATTTAQQRTRRAAVISEEERRRNRMTSNRLSARKSRMRRQQHVEELAAHAERLARENEAMRAGVDGALRRCRLLEQENRVLAAHARELCAALALRNSQLRTLGDVAGVPLDVPGVPGHLVQLYGGDDMQIMPPAPPPPVTMGIHHQVLFWPDAVDAAVGMLGF